MTTTTNVMTTIKAISLWQPWASLVALGAKQFETRSWATAYRGPLVIHAAKRFTRDELAFCKTTPFKAVLQAGGIMRASDLPLGAALCVVDLMEIIPTEEALKRISYREREFGNYGPGRFAWRLANVRKFDEPIPAKGMQGIWEWRLGLSVLGPDLGQALAPPRRLGLPGETGQKARQ